MQKKGKILIADDDKSILKSLKILLDEEFELVNTVSNPNLILAEYEKCDYDIVLLDMNFTAGINSGNEGIYWMNEIIKKDCCAIIILLTAYGDIDLAVKAIKQGATDFIIKPWNNDKLISTLKAAYKLRLSQKEVNKLGKEKENLTQAINKPNEKIIAESKSIKKIIDLIDKVSATDANILITGENGTGKEVLAREIHQRSAHSKHALITVDVGSISESLFESELFGHKKGAFTDAREDRAGRFEVANGSTLFLDEIGNIPLNLQSKLLTALQNRQVTPLGSNVPVPIDVRLICATNKNINELIQQGLFREDLYYRINTVEIEIPPLRDRMEDIIPLAKYFLDIYGKKYQKQGLHLGAAACDSLRQYHWPGNIRELRHAIEKAVILSTNNTLSPEDFMLKHENKKTQWPLTFDEIEKKAIARALENNNGKIIDAARELGLTRQTLHNKIKKYNL